MRDAGRRILYGPQTPLAMINIVDSYFEQLVDLLEIIKAKHNIRSTEDADCKGLAKSADIAALRQQAIELHYKFSAWHTELTELGLKPEEVPSQSFNSPFSTILWYKSPAVGAMFMGYWASLLIVQEALNYCQDSTWQTDREEQLVQNIVQSVECVGQDEVGLLRILFAIHIAYEFADRRLQLWIQETLPRIRVNGIDVL